MLIPKMNFEVYLLEGRVLCLEKESSQETFQRQGSLMSPQLHFDFKA
jgi:hypothetical protein